MNSVTTQREKTRKIVLIGILGGLTVFLTFTPFGFIPIGPITLTTMHIPVILAACIGGPLVGGIVGLMFGLASMVNAILKPSILSPAFLNPFISVIPRIIFGVATGYIHLGLTKISKTSAIYYTSILVTLLHSLLILSLLFFFYQSLFGANTQAAFLLILTIFFTNTLPEIFTAALIVSPIYFGLTHSKK
ncbi:membrane protein [Erysipelotrichaceae bacterium]|nr:membrane protein [Erysipelotrichaceae bacterium]